MKKVKHNKKRNTAVLYEVLVMELTKAVVKDNIMGKKNVLRLLKESFKKGTALSKEMELYRLLNESRGMSDDLARRLLDRVVQTYNEFDTTAIFIEQSDLLSKMNKVVDKAVFNNFIPDYKNLATIAQIFSKSSPIKDRVLLEQKMVERMTTSPDEKTDDKLEVIDNLTYRTFVKKFNEAYGKSLLPEQKELVTKYVMAFSDNGVELKLYLNEELSRLKKEVGASLESEEIKTDPSMVKKTNQLLEKMSSYSQKPIDQALVNEVLRIQSLIQEIKE